MVTKEQSVADKEVSPDLEEKIKQLMRKNLENAEVVLNYQGFDSIAGLLEEFKECISLLLESRKQLFQKNAVLKTELAETQEQLKKWIDRDRKRVAWQMD